jgi:hypothetical protein
MKQWVFINESNLSISPLPIAPLMDVDCLGFFFPLILAINETDSTGFESKPFCLNKTGKNTSIVMELNKEILSNQSKTVSLNAGSTFLA